MNNADKLIQKLTSHENHTTTTAKEMCDSIVFTSPIEDQHDEINALYSVFVKAEIDRGRIGSISAETLKQEVADHLEEQKQLVS